MKKEGNYYIMTDSGKIRFKVWLVQNHISMRDFAKTINKSCAYVSQVVSGKKHITEKVRQLFKKGGYELI